MRPTILVLLLATTLWAWDTNGTPVCTAPTNQLVCKTVSLAGGRLALVWEDHRNITSGNEVAAEVYFQILDSLGKPVLAKDGVKVSGMVGIQKDPQIAGNGVDVFLAWMGATGQTPDNAHIYMARMDGLTGQRRWRDVAACDTPLLPYVQLNPRLCLSGTGDQVYVSWGDYRPGDLWAYVSRVTPEGVVAFTTPMCSIPGRHGNPLVVMSAEGALVLWNGYVHEPDTIGVFANRLVNDRFLWGPTGKLVLPYPSSFTHVTQGGLPLYAISDSLGAYVFPAVDPRYATGSQHIDSAGRLTYDSVLSYYAPDAMGLTSDRSCVACYARGGWYDDMYPRVQCVKIDSSGGRPWGDTLEAWRSTVPDSSPPIGHIPPTSVVGDGHGGCVIAIASWLTKRETDILVVHVDSAGQVVGEPTVACDAPGPQGSPVIVREQDGSGYLVAWEDRRGPDWDIYATHLDSLLNLGIAEDRGPETGVGGTLPVLAVGPNPARGAVTVRYSLPAGEPGRLDLLDATGRVVESRALPASAVRSPHSLRLTPHCPPGVYFIRLTSSSSSVTAKLVKLE